MRGQKGVERLAAIKMLEQGAHRDFAPGEDSLATLNTTSACHYLMQSAQDYNPSFSRISGLTSGKPGSATFPI